MLKQPYWIIGWKPYTKDGKSLIKPLSLFVLLMCLGKKTWSRQCSFLPWIPKESRTLDNVNATAGEPCYKSKVHRVRDQRNRVGQHRPRGAGSKLSPWAQQIGLCINHSLVWAGEPGGSECLYFRTKENFTLSGKAARTKEGVNLVNGKVAGMGIVFLFDVRTV